MGTFNVMVSRQHASIERGSRLVARRPGTGGIPGRADDATAAVHKLIHKLPFVCQCREEAGLTDFFA
jgi:hypothetical protein